MVLREEKFIPKERPDFALGSTKKVPLTATNDRYGFYSVLAAIFLLRNFDPNINIDAYRNVLTFPLPDWRMLRRSSAFRFF